MLGCSAPPVGNLSGMGSLRLCLRRDGRFLDHLVRGLCKSADALRANEFTNAADFGGLEVRVFSAPVHGVVVTTQKLAGALHLGSFLACCTLSHRGDYN